MDGSNGNGNRSALATRPAQFSLAPTNFDEAMRFAELIAKSDLAPKDYKGKPGNAMIAMQMGAEVGLAPMQAIQNIAVINGRPSVWGDAMLALCQAHPDYEDTEEDDDGETATCTARRRGRTPKTRTFSMAEAAKAGLTNKDSPWKTYPKRMRQMRARAFALRDQWADVLRGLSSAEEVSDIPIDATPRRRAEPRAERSAQPANAQPVDKAKVIDEPAEQAPAVDGDDYVITFGKNVDKRLRDLTNAQLHWYAEDYKGRDVELKRRARAVIDTRKALAAAANEKALDDMGGNPDWGMGDAPDATDAPKAAAVFLPGLNWEHREQWNGKSLMLADLETLLRYEVGLKDAIEVEEDHAFGETLRANLREAELAITFKEPKS